jgi:glycosyltransferase involved in cell wall biosynthesis
MKLLVFAHVPPPHHGQSYMVKLMLDGFGGDARGRETKQPSSEIECYHVNARFSDTLEDIGTFRFGKFLSLLRYCLSAIGLRFRYGVRTFYYVPAPGKRAALIRDWVVMLLCRPFFKNFIHHWHAVGVGDWLQREGSWIERRLTHWLLGRPALGVSLAIPSMRDALWFRSENVELVSNGIPDPCPNFETEWLPQRRPRLAARIGLLSGGRPEGKEPNEDTRVFRVLFLGNLLRDKGIFDTLEAVAIANQTLHASGSPLRMHLAVAGAFPEGTEEQEFRERIDRDDLRGRVSLKGFVSGTAKTDLLRESDCLCFPSYYHAESFGLVVVEAMASGMAVVTSRWRALPSLLPPDYPGIVSVRDPQAVAAKLIDAMREDATPLRAWYLSHFTEAVHLDHLREALLKVAPDA